MMRGQITSICLLVTSQGKQDYSIQPDVKVSPNYSSLMQELENYMLDLRRQLQEASEERATLIKIQRQNRADMEEITEKKEAADQQAEAMQRQNTLQMNQLKVSRSHFERSCSNA